MDAEKVLASLSAASDETEFYAPMPAGYKPGKTKYVIVFGTVMSGLGKGIFSSSLAKCLKDRGLTGVRLVISDACRGLVEAVTELYPNADWQRCVVHFYRNVFSHVPNTKVAEVARMWACQEFCVSRAS